MPKIDDGLKADVVKWSAFYEHRIRTGSVCHSSNFCYHMSVLISSQKVIFHLEAFVTKFMRLYEGCVLKIVHHAQTAADPE
jgi:replication factor C subunit 3/5